ncbi:MAG TPA: tRNA glutamyl-Q(34) synthetase GluQRS [Xanthomonadaceae bacterium]|nr:tRNA glutamyl-Q(34) synthetase GluQRS [Xanthomonadaceae bacterium]
MAADYRGRFAPSPTGALHLGSLVAALGSWLRARSRGGTWLVRVEDIDPPREVPGAANAQLEALARFGMEPDEPVLRQSTRTDAYLAACARLQTLGQAYPCRCSRTDLARYRGVHPERCVASDSERAPALRMRIGSDPIGFRDRVLGPQSFTPRALGGDFVVRRVEGWAAYHLAVVVDDAAQGITEIVRGCDLLDSTPRQIVLQRALGLSTPGYAHLPLVTDAHGRKLSKSTADLPVDPCDPLPALRRALAFLGQQVPAADDVRRMLRAAVECFDLDRVPRAPAASAGRRQAVTPSR